VHELESYSADQDRRTAPLREIVLARALYHCGDYGGLGEQILNEYARDIRGLFARHAQAVLGRPQLNVPELDLELTTEEILEAIREGRRPT
jgi:hypothetical protein